MLNSHLFPRVKRALGLVTASRRPGLTTAPPHLQALKVAYLQEVDIFQDLTHDEMAWIKDSTRMVTVPAGQVIYDQGEPSETLFILKRGRVQLYRLTTDGKKLEIDTVHSGTFFGEMPLIDEHLRETSAEALEESLVCVLEREDLERIVLAKPRVALRLLEKVSERLAGHAARLEAFAFHSVAERLAAVLLRLEQGGTVHGTHQELAEAVGVYRETVSKVLADFQRQGLVDLGRKQVTITDRAAIEHLANHSRPAVGAI